MHDWVACVAGVHDPSHALHGEGACMANGVCIVKGVCMVKGSVHGKADMHCKDVW